METFSLGPVYKLGSRGETRVWEVGFDGDRLWTKSGQVGGKMTLRTAEVKTNSSGRTLDEQALLEAKSRLKKKKDEGYVDDLTETPDEERLPEPMAGNIYRDDLVDFPLLAQAKLDGTRLVCSQQNGKFVSRSRKNKPLNHFEELKKEVLEFLGETEIILDGELYSLTLPFHILSGATRAKNKPSPDEDGVILVVFDQIDLTLSATERIENLGFQIEKWSERKKKKKLLDQRGYNVSMFLKEISPHLYFVRTWEIANEAELLEFHEAIKAVDIEGVMVRQMTGNRSKYQCRRSQHLLKIKEYQTFEGKIVGFSEGTGTEEGRVIWDVELEDDETSTTKIAEGEIVKMRPCGTFELREEWFQNGANYIGRRVTYKCLKINEDTGIPREPIVLRFRDD